LNRATITIIVFSFVVVVKDGKKRRACSDKATVIHYAIVRAHIAADNSDNNISKWGVNKFNLKKRTSVCVNEMSQRKRKFLYSKRTWDTRNRSLVPTCVRSSIGIWLRWSHFLREDEDESENFRALFLHVSKPVIFRSPLYEIFLRGISKWVSLEMRQFFIATDSIVLEQILSLNLI
jgi:hypothetical protein